MFHPYDRITGGHLNDEIYQYGLSSKEKEETRKGNVTELFIIFCMQRLLVCFCMHKNYWKNLYGTEQIFSLRVGVKGHQFHFTHIFF